MPFKQVLFRSAARDKILRGATQLTDAVRVTRDDRQGVRDQRPRGESRRADDAAGGRENRCRRGRECRVVASVLPLAEATMTEIPETKKERVPEPELGM